LKQFCLRAIIALNICHNEVSFFLNTDVQYKEKWTKININSWCLYLDEHKNAHKLISIQTQYVTQMEQSKEIRKKEMIFSYVLILWWSAHLSSFDCECRTSIGFLFRNKRPKKIGKKERMLDILLLFLPVFYIVSIRPRC
jgi:hypothetical protein